MSETHGSEPRGMDALQALATPGAASETTREPVRDAQGGLIHRQRLGDAMAHRAGLAGEARADHGDLDVELAEAAGHFERLGQHHAQHRPGEVDLLVAAVDGDLAFARLDPDAGDGVLALAGGV